MTQVDDLYAFYIEAETCGALFDHLLVAEQHGYAYAVLICGDGGTKHVVGIGFAKHDAFRIALCLFGEAAHEFIVVAHQLTEFFVVGFPVGDRTFGYARFHGATGYCRCHCGYKARVEGFGQYVIAAEVQIRHAVGCVDH